MKDTIDAPETMPPNVKDGELRKWDFLKNAPKNDAQFREIRVRAYHLREASRGSAWPDWCFAQLCHAIARDCIVYLLDSDRVGREQIDGFTDPQGMHDEPFRRGRDDCDAKARFFVALCLAGGLQASMVDRWKLINGLWELAHVYGRVIVQGPDDKASRWYLAETILRRAKLGEIAEQVPKEPDTGRWLF